MPSWPPRLHLGSSTPASDSKSKAGALKSPLYHGDQISDDMYHDQPIHGVPVIALTNTSSPSRPSHGRSYSHPLTSIFSKGKKAEEVFESVFNDDAQETSIEFPSTSAGLASKGYIAANGNSLQNGDGHFVIGNCITCNSRVRWPKHLDVFRCTVCLMVNDLKPKPALSIGGRGCESLSTPTPSPHLNLARKVPYLSLNRTRNLIDQCVALHLQSRLEHDFEHHPQSEKLQKKRDDGKDILASSLPRGITLKNSNRGHIAPTMISSSKTSPPPPQSASQTSSFQINSATAENPQQYNKEYSRLPYWPLENYLIACFGDVECLNMSFLTVRPHHMLRATSEGTALKAQSNFAQETLFPELDAKTLLLGDFAENGTWWTGRSDIEQPSYPGNAFKAGEGVSEGKNMLNSPRVDWAELDEWYSTVTTLGRSWRDVLDEKGKAVLQEASATSLQHIEDDLGEACAHVQLTLLKLTEDLLRRPGRPLRNPEDCRFLLILLKNPLLYETNYSNAKQSTAGQCRSNASLPLMASLRQPSMSDPRSSSTGNGSTGKHSGIIKRIMGLMSNLPSHCHHRLIVWFSRLSESHFRRLVELVGTFVTYRLTRQHGRKKSNRHEAHDPLVPRVSGPSPSLGLGSSAQLHLTLGSSGAPNSPDRNDHGVPYDEDWQIKAAARVMSLLFFANKEGLSQRHDNARISPAAVGRSKAGSAARNRAHRHGQLLPTNAFYNTLLDCSDLVADFEAWESRKGRFTFCQYPMFLSISAKIRIMEHDARRQMEIKAREAFFNSIMTRKAINQYLVLKVRRNCLVEDSLRSVSEIVGTGQEEIKKGLRIEFLGEEGFDSGGLRKEWFLLLVREVFDQEHGLFVYDEDSHYCYFNPNSFETSDQFFLVGAVLGLAIYNSTILDVALPPFVFRKLLASAPSYTGPATSALRPNSEYTLEDLAEFRPTLAKGLRQLLEFDGDVRETFCRNFVAGGERYGQLMEIPLHPNSENRAVTNSNRHEFVDLYIKYLLDTSVARQYEPFKRGFFTVCGGNALSLFQPEEIELLVRGSDEPLEVPTLRAVAVYDGWGKGINASEEPVVNWFWDAFGKASPKNQRKLLSFITSSDRIPATGATSLVIKITCLGDHSIRFPIARTCFNMLGLYRYRDRNVLEDKLWRAVIESEGFGIK